MDKKSFVLHYDSLSILDKLSDEQCGKLLRKMKSYHNGNTYEPNDMVVEIAFEQFRNQFDRDKEKFNKVCERNKEIANKRRNKEVPESTKSTSGKSGIPESTRNAESDNDSDNDKENDNNILYIELNKQEYNIYNDIKQEFIDYWNEPDKKGKPKWMKEKTWDLSGRLRTRARNKKTNFGRKEILKFDDPIQEFNDYMKKDKYNELKQVYKERYGTEWKKPFFDTKYKWVAYDFGMAFSN